MVKEVLKERKNKQICYFKKIRKINPNRIYITYTIWDKLRGFSGSSGKRGIFVFPFSGTHRKDFRREWPICLLGDF